MSMKGSGRDTWSLEWKSIFEYVTYSKPEYYFIWKRNGVGPLSIE